MRHEHRPHHSHAPQKERAVWFRQNVSFPLRDATPVQLEKFWASQLQADISPEHRWQCAGPYNIAGRVTALAIHPQKPDTWFAGSATGGVWKSRDAGQSWHPTWSRFANQNIGALAWINFNGVFATADAEPGPLLFAATGEANMSPDSYAGSGVYSSADEGLTWGPYFYTPSGASTSIESSVSVFPRRIGNLASSGNRLAIGSVFLDDSLPAGLYLCDLATPGLTACEYWGKRSYNCHCVLFHPSDPDTLYACIEPDGSHNGIWRSNDFGKTWTHLTTGLPSGDQFRRTSLAFAPGDPDVIYALASDRANYILGIFRSADGGNSWREILGGLYPKERQMSYNNVIAVHPSKPDSIVWGGMHLYRTDNAGREWRRITNNERGAKDYVHADHHALLWPEDDTIISGNDGGVSVTNDGGLTWTERSRGMVSTMFYELDVAPTDGSVFGGGTQDNGTLIAGVGGVHEGDFVPAIPGDGAWLVFDPADLGNVFGCATGFQVYYHRSGQPWTFEAGGWKPVPPKQIPAEEVAQRQFTVMAIEPSSRGGTKNLWAGSNRLWRTNNKGRSWTAASPTFDGTPISAIEISRVKLRLMYVGTTAGGIFRTQDGGKTWSQNLSCIDIPARAVTSIQTHPKDTSTVVVTIASSGLLSSGVRPQTGEQLPYSHVFRSDDMGETWTDIDSGALPNVVFYAAAYETAPPYRLFIAGDVGVWAHIESGWLNISGNLPSVVVSDLVYHDKDRTLTAATYGRGVWRMHPGELRVTAADTASTALEQIEIAAGLRVDPAVAAPVPISPDDGAVTDVTPRKTLVKVEPVPGALGYQLEISDQGLTLAASSVTPEITFKALGPHTCQHDALGQ